MEYVRLVLSHKRHLTDYSFGLLTTAIIQKSCLKTSAKDCLSQGTKEFSKVVFETTVFCSHGMTRFDCRFFPAASVVSNRQLLL